jgi:hypothetical protein
MAFTRFHDDKARIEKALQQTTYIGRYQLNAPGQGIDLPYVEDPQMRLQGWGANLNKDCTDLESDLRGLTRHLTRDNIDSNDFKKHAAQMNPVMYRSEDPFIEESRATHPAWRYKDLEHPRWEKLPFEPIHDIERNMEFAISSRKLAKDDYVIRQPVVEGVNQYYMTGNSLIHLGGEKGGDVGTLYENKYHTV